MWLIVIFIFSLEKNQEALGILIFNMILQTGPNIQGIDQSIDRDQRRINQKQDSRHV